MQSGLLFLWVNTMKMMNIYENFGKNEAILGNGGSL